MWPAPQAPPPPAPSPADEAAKKKEEVRLFIFNFYLLLYIYIFLVVSEFHALRLYCCVIQGENNQGRMRVGGRQGGGAGGKALAVLGF